MASGSALHSSLKTRAASVSTRVVFENRHRALRDDRPVVVIVVGKMDRAAADLRTHLEDSLVDFAAVKALAAKGRNQRGVDVDHAALVVGRDFEKARKPARTTRSALLWRIGLEDRSAELGRRSGVVVGQRERNSRGLGPGDRPDSRPAGDDLNDLGLQTPGPDQVDQVLKRRSLARDAHRQSDRWVDDRRIAWCFAHGEISDKQDGPYWIMEPGQENSNRGRELRRYYVPSPAVRSDQ